MFASSKPGWHLFFIILATTSIISTTITLGYDRHVFRNTRARSLHGIISAETVSALQDDVQLHSTILSMTERLARTSNDFGERFGVESVQKFGAELANNVETLRKRQELELEKRGLFDNLRDAFQGFTGGGNQGNSTENGSRKGGFLGGLFGGGGSGGGGLLGNLFGGGGLNLTGGISGIFDNLSTKLVDGLQDPALFLGIGVGMGASEGLNLTDMKTINEKATQIATAFNSSATGINLVVRNLGSGLAAQLTSAFGQGSGADGGGGSSLPLPDINFGSVAFALASGIGNGTAKGLKLTQADIKPLNDSSIEAIVGNLGLGITMPIASNIDLQSIMSGLGGGADGGGAAGGFLDSVKKKLPQIAAAAGNGLGEGVKNGLGLASPKAQPKKRQQPDGQQPDDPLQGIDLPGTVEQFTKGLSQSVLTGVDFAKIGGQFNLSGGMGGLGDLANNFDIKALLPGLAAGAGSGIGLGAAIGLNFRSDDATPMLGNGPDKDTAMVAEKFTQNLVSNFLMNSTIFTSLGQMAQDSQPELLKDFNVAKTVEGFARGAVEGVMSAFTSVGGVGNLLNGNFSQDAMMKVPVLEPSTFDDSLNGSAVAFARGLAGEGTILVADVLKQLTSGDGEDGANGEPKTSPQKRDLGLELTALAIRQASGDMDMGSLIPEGLAIDEQTVMTVGQFAIDRLTCKGIGGVAAVGLGVLMGGENGASLTDLANSAQSPLDPRIIQSLPEGPVQLTSEGNTFQIVLRNADIHINGMAVIPFGIITALHILFMSISFLLALPIYFILGVIWRLCIIAGYPVNEAKNKRWRAITFGLFGIFGLIGFILGIAGMGDSRHFRDTHGITGLIAFILFVPAIALGIVRLRTKAPFPTAEAFVGIKAPFALFRTEQRIFLISGVLNQILLTASQALATNGFSTLRSVSLCIVDAILSSEIVFGIAAFLLMLQISANGLVAFRLWLETHIAKRQTVSEQGVVFMEKGEPPAPQPPRTKKEKPSYLNMKIPKLPRQESTGTKQLRGSEDKQISTPFNVRKDGNDRERSPSPSPVANPFLSSSEQAARENRRTYNPKTAAYDYSYEYKSAIDDNDFMYDEPRKAPPATNVQFSGRPSSEAFPPSPPPTRPPRDGVTLEDFMMAPPSPPLQQQQPQKEQADGMPIHLTVKSRTPSFSRPFGRPSINASFVEDYEKQQQQQQGKMI